MSNMVIHGGARRCAGEWAEVANPTADDAAMAELAMWADEEAVCAIAALDAAGAELARWADEEAVRLLAERDAAMAELCACEA